MKIVLFFILVLSHFTYGQTCDPNLYSLSFNGSTSYVEINPSDTFNLTTKITVEAWIKAYKWADTYEQGSIVCKHGWSEGEKGYVLRAGGDGQLSFNIANLNEHGEYVGWKEALSQPGAMQLNIWYHVAGVYNGSKLQLYINGVRVKEVNVKGSIVPSPYKLKIGRIADDGASNKRYWNGLIDEVRIWNDNRNENEIRDNKSHHISPSSQGLVGYWRFTEGSGSTAVSVSIQETATLIASDWNMDVPFTNGVIKPVIIQLNGQLISPSTIGNQWNMNGVPIPGQTNQNFTPLQNGEYSLTIDSGSGCIATSDAVFYSTVGISKIESQNIKCIVNNRFLIFIDIPSVLENGVFTLNDMVGKKVFTGTISSNHVDLSGFSAGQYIVSFSTGQKVYSMRIFVD